VKVRYHPSARAELRQARDWYEEQQAGLGIEFLDAIQATVAAIRQAPERWPHVREEPRARRSLVERFPFAVVYAVLGEVIFIVAVAHLRRAPGDWRMRLGTPS
jgi:plasmid stabilization system protein ParE